MATAKKKAEADPKIDMSWGQCLIYSTMPLNCPLCGATIGAKVQHQCKKEPGKKPIVIE